MSHWGKTQQNKLVKIYNYLDTCTDFVDSSTIAKAVGFQTKDIGGMLRGREEVEQIKSRRSSSELIKQNELFEILKGKEIYLITTFDINDSFDNVNVLNFKNMKEFFNVLITFIKERLEIIIIMIMFATVLAVFTPTGKCYECPCPNANQECVDTTNNANDSIL